MLTRGQHVMDRVVYCSANSSPALRLLQVCAVHHLAICSVAHACKQMHRRMRARVAGCYAFVCGGCAGCAACSICVLRL